MHQRLSCCSCDGWGEESKVQLHDEEFFFHVDCYRDTGWHCPRVLSLPKETWKDHNRLPGKRRLTNFCSNNTPLEQCSCSIGGQLYYIGYSSIMLAKGGLHLKPPKFEHIFVAVITFPPFLLCKYFWYQLVAYCVCFKMIYKKSLYKHLFLEDTSKHARVTQKMALTNLWQT